VIPHPDPVSPVTADGTADPNRLELYDNATPTSPVTPGRVSSWSVNRALPVPTSTDRFAVPDTPNGSRVALRRAPAAGAGFTVAAAAGATATMPTDTIAAAVTAAAPTTRTRGPAARPVFVVVLEDVNGPAGDTVMGALPPRGPLR